MILHKYSVTMKEFNYKINGSPYRVVVNHADSSVVELEVNGTPYTVELEQKTKKTTLSGIKRPAAPAAAAPVVSKPKVSKGANAIKSPLPGVILDIRCKAGDAVKKGETLMILEAMKMENNILANDNGTVREILVQKGDSILEGADLIIIE